MRIGRAGFSANPASAEHQERCIFPVPTVILTYIAVKEKLPLKNGPGLMGRILKYLRFLIFPDPIDIQRMRETFVRVFVEKRS